MFEQFQNYRIGCHGKHSEAALAKGLNNLYLLCEHVKYLKYSRTSSRSDLTLVLTEERGTCSSKHGLVKAICDENNFLDIALILNVFKMSATNTPYIGKILTEAQLDYLPEAHVYLEIGKTHVDLSYPSVFSTIDKDESLTKFEIDYEDVVEYKTLFHKNYLNQWRYKLLRMKSFEEIWEIREQCVTARSVNNI